MNPFRFLSPALKLAAIAIAGLAIAGCGATRAAYKAANDSGDAENRAFVVAEHYQALQHEAATLVEQPGTPAAVRDAIKAIDAKATPLILGDSSIGKAGVRDLARIYQAAADAYDAVQNAETEAAAAQARAQFEAAMADAIHQVAQLIRLLRKEGAADLAPSRSGTADRFLEAAALVA